MPRWRLYHVLCLGGGCIGCFKCVSEDGSNPACEDVFTFFPDSANQQAGQPVDLSTCQPVNLSICQPVDLSTCQPVGLSTCQPVDLSTCRSINLSTCRSINLSTCQPVDLSTCQPVNLSASFLEARGTFLRTFPSTVVLYKVQFFV